jgi:hypothetical protein
MNRRTIALGVSPLLLIALLQAQEQVTEVKIAEEEPLTISLKRNLKLVCNNLTIHDWHCEIRGTLKDKTLDVQWLRLRGMLLYKLYDFTYEKSCPVKPCDKSVHLPIYEFFSKPVKMQIQDGRLIFDAAGAKGKALKFLLESVSTSLTEISRKKVIKGSCWKTKGTLKEMLVTNRPYEVSHRVSSFSDTHREMELDSRVSFCKVGQINNLISGGAKARFNLEKGVLESERGWMSARYDACIEIFILQMSYENKILRQPPQPKALYTEK